MFPEIRSRAIMESCKGCILLTYDLEGSACDLAEIVSLNLTSAAAVGGTCRDVRCPGTDATRVHSEYKLEAFPL